MANKNAGIHRAWEHGGKILFGSSGHAVLSVVAGSLSVTEGGRTLIPHVDRGKMSGVAYFGNEQPTQVSLTLRLTAGSLAAAGEIRSIVEQTVTTGKAQTIPIVIQIPSVETGSSGEEFNLNYCALNPGGFVYRAGSGDEMDTIELSFTNFEAAIDFATY